MVSNWKSIFVLELWITVELEQQFGRKYQGCWGAVFLSKPVVSIEALGWESFVFLFRLRCACIIISTVLRLRCAVIISSTVELEKHFIVEAGISGRNYQGWWGAGFLLRLRFATVDYSRVGKHFGRKYQGCCGAVFLLKRRLAIITMNGVELEKLFCS